MYADAGPNLLIDVKGRKLTTRSPARRPAYQNWTTEDDIADLARWSALFGPQFRAVFLFLFWCDAQPPDALFQDMFEFQGRWYAARVISLDAYRRAMRPRSAKWRTVNLRRADFEALSQPLDAWL